VPIPKQQRHWKRYYRVAARILLEEQVLRGHCRCIVRDLDRRRRVPDW
jgi:hypothetical protein